MLKVGITGGIGTGKTFVCQIFRILRVPIYYADDRAKALVVQNPELKSNIIRVFGPKAYLSDGAYNKVFIGELINKDPDAKSKLNELIHPEVFKDTVIWFEDQKDEGHPYALKEAALIYETGGEKYLDKVIVIDAPLPMRIARLKKRDHKSEPEILLRINTQWPQEMKVKKSDFVIYNDGQLALIPQVNKIHQELIRLSSLNL